MTTKLSRLLHMDRRELAWRGRAVVHTTAERAGAALSEPRWQREDLLAAIGRADEARPIREALRAHRWNDAHRAIASWAISAPPAFPIAPGLRQDTARRILDVFPASAHEAASRADRITEGRYDLLGYRALSFGDRDAIDWHFDPVHGRRAPRAFWSSVPYLSPAVGDHKIIWELNRHQHWLALGRAYWLTGTGAYRDTVISQITSWMNANPPLVGINWASMLELAFRSLSWVWALQFFADNNDRDEEPWCVDLLLGLDRQLCHIERHLSYYFSPNTHLLGEALALYVAGRSLPILARSSRWAAVGRSVLLAEISRQIAEDGGHCERSTHYHRYALDFYLLALIVARLSADPAAAQLEEAVVALAGAARSLADDRGRLPHIGDDDGGGTFQIAGRPLDDIADSLEAASVVTRRPELRAGPATEEAMWLLADPMWASALDEFRNGAAASPPRSADLPRTGYYISRSRGGTHAVMDAGPHGYRNGGHAHADALALTLAIRNVPFLIDPGTHCYTIDTALRDRMRSTALHNTVAIDERPASVPGGPFHWAHSANAYVHRWRTNDRFDYLDSAHDGYAPTVHRRRVLSMHDDLLVVADLVRGKGAVRADAHWHLDPRWAVRVSPHGAIAAYGGDQVDVSVPGGGIDRFVGDSETGLGWHAPIYGQLEPATTLRITRTGHMPLWVVTVFGLDANNAIDTTEIVPVWSAAGALDHSLAVKITRATTTDYVVLAEPRERSRASIWRAAGIETDAAMLLCRIPRDASGGAVEVALVDGSFARAGGHAPFAFELPSFTESVYLDESAQITMSPGRPHVRDSRIR